MYKHKQKHSGYIVFRNPDGMSSAVLSIRFENAYCISYKKSVSAATDGILLEMIITPEFLKFGNIDLTMVNGLKTDMEHKNTNDKNEYHFQLPEVVVKGKMPGWMRRQLGMALHRNPALFRKCMKNATSLEEKQFYFNLAFNAAREEAGQQFVQAALTAAGVISAISTAGVSLASATSFGRQAALLGRGALLKGSTYAGRIASSIEAASLRGGMAVQNTIMRSATHLRTLSNITGRMLYPKA